VPEVADDRRNPGDRLEDPAGRPVEGAAVPTPAPRLKGHAVDEPVVTDGINHGKPALRHLGEEVERERAHVPDRHHVGLEPVQGLVEQPLIGPLGAELPAEAGVVRQPVAPVHLQPAMHRIRGVLRHGDAGSQFVATQDFDLMAPGRQRRHHVIAQGLIPSEVVRWIPTRQCQDPGHEWFIAKSRHGYATRPCACHRRVQR
jgi:hypothetical protein